MMFSLRIVNADSYQSSPTKGYDICYSEFRGCEVFKVPIIRIFGITPAGQKGCLHVHGVFPYFSIRCRDVFPNVEAKSLRKCMQELAMNIDRALNIASRNSNSHRQHVYKIVVTEQIPFYGFHERAEEFLKIYFYSPFDVNRTAELMTNGAILNKFIQPYEAHIPYILQFFIDYNLFGMNLINVSKFKFRASEDCLISPMSPLRNQNLSHTLDESTSITDKIWNVGSLSSSQISNLPRQTVCELEADCCSSEIMNRLNESFSSGKNPGLLAIWEEERLRRKAENDTSLLTPVPSQERTDFIETESENFYKKKLRKILESFDLFKVGHGQRGKIGHSSKDSDSSSQPGVLDLSSTQDEDMLNMMLSMVNSQSAQLDDDSILGLNHENDMQTENVDDETQEMSQLFTGELEEMWSSQISNTETDRTMTDVNTSACSNEPVHDRVIPQLDGAFDDQEDDFKPVRKQAKKVHKKPVKDVSEEFLIKSCTLYQPFVKLTPAVIIKPGEEIKPENKPAENRPKSCLNSESLDNDSSVSNLVPKRKPIPICVPVSRNPCCSLIMNICENSNDVSIEHTCDSLNKTQLDSLADVEDPSNVVFEILTNLVYKVECLTEGKTSCYAHLTEEYKGISYSDKLYQGLSSDEKKAISQIKAAASDYEEEKTFYIRRDHFNESHFSLPLKKRISRNDQCDSCSHSLAMDFSKIGKEVVLVRKLSESDLKNVNLNSLKVVIPPLPLHSISSLSGSSKIEDSCPNKPMSSVLSIPQSDPKVFPEKAFFEKLFLNFRSSESTSYEESEMSQELTADNSIEAHSESEENTPNTLQPDNATLYLNENIHSPLNDCKSISSPLNDCKSISSPLNDYKSINSSLNDCKSTSSPLNDCKSISSPLNDCKSISSPLNDYKSISSPLNDCESINSPLNDCKSISSPLNSDCKNISSPLYYDSKNIRSPLSDNSENISIPLNKDIKNISFPLSYDSKNICSPLSYHCKNIPSPLSNDCKNIPSPLSNDCQNIRSPPNNESKNFSVNTASHLEWEKRNESFSHKLIHTEIKMSEDSIKEVSDSDSSDEIIVVDSPDFENNVCNKDSSINQDLVSKDENVTDKNTYDKNSDIDIQKLCNPDNTDDKNLNVQNSSNPDIKHNTEDKSSFDGSAEKINDVASCKVIDSNDSEIKDLNIIPFDEKKCPSMSELRLYRRKRSLFGKDKDNQKINLKKNLPISKLNQESSSTFVPIVKLEPCKDLIDRYCKKENTDNDCLILREISSESKKPPVIKEKRFFRSGIRELRGQSLNSKISINHKLGLNASKPKNNRFVPAKKNKRTLSSSSSSHNSSHPVLRKRSANSNSPSKKKLPNLNSKYASEKLALDKKLEQVYDFEAHLNADDCALDSKTPFSWYSLQNKSFTSSFKKDISGKLSLKLNRKSKIITHIDSVPHNGNCLNSDSQCNRPTRSRPARRASASVICYNEDHFKTQSDTHFKTQNDTQFLANRTNRNSYTDNSNCENSTPNHMDAEVDSGEVCNWSIDDIPISQLKTTKSLKCTISKKGLNFENNLHEVERLPIPKFKVRKKLGTNSLNVSIRIRRTSSNTYYNDNDFEIEKKSFHHSSKKKIHKKYTKSSKKYSQVLSSALDVKHKYKKCKKSKNNCLKNAIWQYCNSPAKIKNLDCSTSIKNDAPGIMIFKKKIDFCKPSSLSPTNYTSASTPKEEVSEISNSSPFTEDYSDDSKRSKSSLKMKLKLKRILTRSNEERIVVVGKELEGVDSDEQENKEMSENDNLNPEEKVKEKDPVRKEKSSKKLLGAKGIINQTNSAKLKSKYKCPLLIESKKMEKDVENVEKPLNEEVIESKGKIPKFKYKPLLANISKDLLSETVCNSLSTAIQKNASPKSEHNFSISPKKKSPLKNAESIKKELAYLSEMITTSDNYSNGNPDVKSLCAEIPENCKKTETINKEETQLLLDNNHSSSAHSKLRERKLSSESKVPSRRNSLRCQDFKKFFDSDNEDSGSNSKELASSKIENIEKPSSLVPELYSKCKPCCVELQKLSPFDIEKCVCKKRLNMHISDKVMSCEPLIASFPSPIVDSKSADSYIDPKKIFENLFEFYSPSQSPVNCNNFEASDLVIENDISLGPFSNENSEHSRKDYFKPSVKPKSLLKPADVFTSVEREDMGVLWNLSYFSPPSLSTSEKAPLSPNSLGQKKNTHCVSGIENSVELDDLQKLASRVNQLRSLTGNLMDSEGENSVSVLITQNIDQGKSCVIDAKTSFKNILEENNTKTLDNQDSISSFGHTPAEFEREPMSNKSENFEFPSTEAEIEKVIKQEPNSDQEIVFEPPENLPNVRILDFQECLVESDSEMNPLLNDSEIDSVMSSAEMILSNSMDKNNYEHSMQTDLSFEDSSISMSSKLKGASEDLKNIHDEVMFGKENIDCNLPKELAADLTCNSAIITAADTSSLLISSYKNNTIPVLAINNPTQEGSVSLTALEEPNFTASGQFLPVMLTPLTDNAEFVENGSTVVKESTSGTQDCVNFLEDNELLQSCSVSSTSDIENKNSQVSNALGIPFNGEDDILSMIVKSCDIGEEFDVNVNSMEETENENISTATLCNEMVDNNYVMSGSNFIINSQPDENTFLANSENAVSSSSENNLAHKNAEIVVIKTEPIDVPNMEQIVYEIQDKNLANQTIRTDELRNEDNVLLDSMIHSFYGDDPMYGLQSSASSDNLSLLTPTFQNSNLCHTMQKNSDCNPVSFTHSVIKTDGVALEESPNKLDNYFENHSLQLKNYPVNAKVPLGALQNSLLVTHSLQRISSKKYHFTPTSKPPSRDFIETTMVKSVTENKSKLKNLTEEDSVSSDSSSNSPVNTNNSVLLSLLNKPSKDAQCLSSQSSNFSVSKSTVVLDEKSVINSPVLYKQEKPAQSFSIGNMISTPSSSHIKREFPLPDIVVSPINKEPELIADTNKRKRKLVFEDDSDCPQKLLNSGREKTYSLYNKYARSNQANQSGESLGNLSFSQIDGPTLENSRGFKVASDNYGDTGVRHEVQHLTVMSLEIHVNTRNELRPDPKCDSVTAIFYSIHNDIGIKEEEEIIGMIVVEPISHHPASGQNSSETLRNYLLLCPGVKNGFIYCVENEASLFEKLVSVVREWDPDILIGYEIQMSSWGYLIDRADVLNINLRMQISRLVDKGETKILHVDQDPTVTDQTADLSRLNIIGRIVLCVWRLMRKEITLNVYSFENAYYHVLHKRTPLYSYQDLTTWFLNSMKEKVIRYYVIRVQGSVHLLEKLDIIGRTSELARLFGIQFYEVLSRGSQFRVESMMLRTAAPMSYIPVSPSVRQRSHSRAPECIPLILEPESRFYIDPIVVLDFQSLYPSMIIAYNYCFSTCLGRVEHFGKNVPFEFGCTSLSVPTTLLQKLQNDIHISPTGIAFVKSSVRRGILPSMLEEILNTRIMVKQSMKKIKNRNALKRLLDARQMGLKLIANVTYGYTGASFSGRMPSVEVADSIVGKGRETLERAIHLIENTSKWRAKVVYGDTDSLFILLPGRSKKQAFEIGQEIADTITADNPKPVKLKFEKVYLPCVLQTKKRYVGFMYETIDQEHPVYDAKGIETVRRDSCPATAKILEKSLKILFKTYDVNLVKNYVQKQFSKILSGRASIIDYIFAKEYRGMSGYRPGACVPALEIAKKRLSKDPRSEPRVGERVPYVVVYGFPGLPIIQLVREPIELLRDVNLRINSTYYITRVISPPLERVFNLLSADVKSWYTNLARTFKPTLPMTRTINQHRGTLSQYFVTLSCPSCEKPTFTAVCDECREDLQGTTIALNEKIRQWERTVDHLTQICGSCTKSGSSVDSCISLDCPMLFKLSAAKKDLSQAPYLRKVLANELF